MSKNNSYKKLYLTILKIGQDKVHEGVSFNSLKEELSKRGYDLNNDCIVRSVKQWFYDSFHHTGCDDNPFNSVKDLQNHCDCNFILKGESCLKLLGYQTSRNSWRNGIIAISLSLIAVSVAIYINFIKTSVPKIDRSNHDSSYILLLPKVDTLITFVKNKDSALTRNFEVWSERQKGLKKSKNLRK